MGNQVPSTTDPVSYNASVSTPAYTAPAYTALPSAIRLLTWAIGIGGISAIIMYRFPEFSVIAVLLALLVVAIVGVLVIDAKLVPFYATFHTIAGDPRAVALAFLGFCILTGCCVLAAAVVGGVGHVEAPPYFSSDSTAAYNASPQLRGTPRAWTEPGSMDRCVQPIGQEPTGRSVVRWVCELLPGTNSGNIAKGPHWLGTGVHRRARVIYRQRCSPGTSHPPTWGSGNLDPQRWRAYRASSSMESIRRRDRRGELSRCRPHHATAPLPLVSLPHHTLYTSEL